MMDSLHEDGEELGRSAGVRNRAGKHRELLLQNQYLAAENRILRAHLPSRLRLSNPERETLAEIGKRLGRKALARVACVAKPGTILAWYRKLVAQKFDGSKHRSYPGRPRISPEIEALIVQFARENAGWGYDRIVGALAHLGHTVSDQTIGNVLRRHGIAPAPNGARRLLGRTSSPRTWMCSREATSLQQRCSHGAVWRPITFCSSFIWKAAG